MTFNTLGENYLIHETWKGTKYSAKSSLIILDNKLFVEPPRWPFVAPLNFLPLILCFLLPNENKIYSFFPVLSFDPFILVLSFSLVLFFSYSLFLIFTFSLFLYFSLSLFLVFSFSLFLFFSFLRFLFFSISPFLPFSFSTFLFFSFFFFSFFVFPFSLFLFFWGMR